MKTYKFEKEWSNRVISIGDELYVNGENITVISIIKVDVEEGTIWFTGVPSADLE